MKSVGGLKKLHIAGLFLSAFIFSEYANAVTCTSVAAGGNWNATATWTGCAGGNGTVANTPGSADTAIIATTGASSVTVNVAVTVGALTINSSGTGGLISTSGITVSGATNLQAGVFNLSANVTRIFVGLVTVSGGTWGGTSRAATFRGGLTVTGGTFTAGTGIHTFNTNSQAITGTVAIPRMVIANPITLTNNGTLTSTTSITTSLGGKFINASTVTVTTLTANGTVTNNGTVTVNTGLGGTGSFVQGANSTLFVKGTNTTTTFNATASGNTVNYSGASQTVRATTYANLTTSGSGTKTPGGALTITGLFTNGSGITWAGTTSNFTMNFRNGFVNNGTFNSGTGVHTFNTNSQSFSGTSATTITNGTVTGVTLTNNGTLTILATTISAGASLTNNLTFTATTANVSGTITNNATMNFTTSATVAVTTGSLINTAAGTLTAATLTVNGTATNSGTLTANTALSGTGSFTQNASSTLVLNGTSGITTLSASATSNTVRYSGSAIQTIRVTTYYHLEIASSSAVIDTLSTGTIINGNLTIGNGTVASTVTASADTSLIVNGNFIVNSSATFIAPAAGSVFYLKGNVVNNGTFTHNSGTATFNGIASQNISGSSVVTFNNFTMNNSSGVLLGNDINVNGVLTLSSGVITTSSSNVLLTSSGSVSRSSGHIDGNLSKYVATGTNVVRTFEVGTGSNYSPVVVTFASVTVAGNLLVSSTGSAHPQIATSNLDVTAKLNRYWTLVNSGISFSTYGVTFNYLGGSPLDHDSTSNASSYVVQRFDDSAGTWTNTTLSGTPSTTSAVITGESSFGSTGSSFGIGKRLPTQLAFIQNPTNAISGASLSPSVSVQIQDSNGTVVSSATNIVTIAIGTNAGVPAGTLSGTLSVAAVAGVATFSNLSIDKSGNAYTLMATSTALTSATSNTFNITAGAASKLSFAQQPLNETRASALSPSVTVRVEDANGNLVTTATNSITMSIANNAGSPAGTLGGTLTQSAVSGVATFSDLTIDVEGTAYTLQATATGLTSVVSNPFDITLYSLVIVQQPPSSAVAGASISPSLVVEIHDESGALVTGATDAISVSIFNNPASPLGTLSGTTTVNAVAGVATFSNLSINKTGVAYSLAVSGNHLTGAISNSFNITPGAASQLVYLQQPSHTVAASSISPALSVRIEDSNGNLVTTASNTVTMSIGSNPGSGTLSGTTSVAAASGIATFSNLSINKSGIGYTLAAASTGLTGVTSSSFNITFGAATKLAFLQQPSNATAATSISPSVTVRVEDANGNLVTSASNSISMAIGTNPSSGVLSGTTTVSAVSGLATFSNLSINKSGNAYTLSASTSGLTSATSNTFNINPGVATSLAILQQPTNAVAGSSINPSVTVKILDANLNLVTSATNNITFSIGSNPGSGTLSGTTSVAAVSGVATFSDLSINKIGTGYTLSATSSGLTSVVSNTFDITVGAAAQVVFVQDPSTSVAATSISPSVTVRIEDAFGNLVSGATNSVTMAIQNNAGSPAGTLSGTTVVSASSGIATFSNLSINKSGVGYTLIATAAGLTSDVSTAFDITAGTATQLTFLQQPTNALPSVVIAPDITVRIEDANNNLVTTASNSVTMAIGTNPGSGTLSGTKTIAASSGIATFSTLSINQSGVGYTLVATSTGLTSATSTAFNITASICTSLTGARNWNTAASWNCGRVPLSTDTVVIPNGSTVTLNVNTAAVSSVTINSGGILQGDGTGKILLIDGASGPDLTNNGTIEFSGANSALLKTSGAALDLTQAAANPSVWNFSAIDFNSLGATLQNITDISFDGDANPLQNTTAPITGAINAEWTFSGSVAQTISSANISNLSTWTDAGGSTTFTLSNTAGFNLSSPLTLTGALNLTSTSLLNLNGTTTPMPSVGLTKSFDPTSTVSYLGTGTQTVTAESYGNLVVGGGSTKTFASGTSSIFGDLTINASTTLDGTTNNSSVNLYGDFTNSGTLAFAGTGTFSFTGSAAQNLSGATTFGKVAIANTATGASKVLNINNDMTVTDTLTFTSGRIVTAANKVIVAQGATVSGAGSGTGWVAGNLQKFVAAGSTCPASCPVFEIGTNGASAPSLAYTPVTTSFTGVSASGGSLIASSNLGDHAQIASSGLVSSKTANRWWSLTTTGVSGTALPAFSSYVASFGFVSGDVDAGASTSNFQIAKWNASSWSSPTTNAHLSTSTQATGITTLGEFAIGETAALSVTNASYTYSDPVHGTNNPKSIPGALKQLQVNVSNPGIVVDVDTTVVVVPLGANLSLSVSDVGGASSGPVSFSQGAISSTLTYAYSSLSNMSDDVDFSNNNGSTWTYVPTADANGCDNSVTHMRVRPKGSFASGTPNPSFQFIYRACVK